VDCVIRSRALIAIIAAVLVTMTATGAAEASHSAWAHCSSHWVPNRYTRQWTNNFYHGQFSWFWTYQPAVQNLNTQFSLNHLYPHTNSGTSFVEVGWYRGFGPEKIAVNSSFYTVMQDSVTPYQEKNFQDAPQNTFVLYEAQYIGFNFSTNKYIWRVYANSQAEPGLWTWENRDLGMGKAISGGETNANGNQMIGRIVPSHLLQISGTWYNWTDATMAQLGDSTFICDQPNVVLTYNVRFDDYQFNGTVVP
jgi:hypothetical protein